MRDMVDRLDGATNAQIERPLSNVAACRFYKVVQHRTEVYDIVSRAFRRKDDWEELPHGLGLSNVWNLLWTWSKPRVDYSRLLAWQKVNHFPDAKYLSRKDCLKRVIEKYTRNNNRAADFFKICPRTFTLPKDYVSFIAAYGETDERIAAADERNPIYSSSAEIIDKSCSEEQEWNLWIMKPAVASRGRGIQVVSDLSQISYSEPMIIQRYITNPMLLNGYKFDLRIYVLVTSINPLEAFIYKDGFARISTVPFTLDPEHLGNKYVHLTNSSIQRHNEESMQAGEDQSMGAHQRQQDCLLGGTKLNFTTLKQRLAGISVNWDNIWAKTCDVVLKSLCMASDHIPYNSNSFELYTFHFYDYKFTRVITTTNLIDSHHFFLI